MLYVITGVRGSGKTTLIDKIKSNQIGYILQPSTTRLPRFEGENEYDFVKEWEPKSYSWTIELGGNKYGMRKSEILKNIDGPCFTVFEPISIEVFYKFRHNSKIKSKTIGLDTVNSLQEQHSRVNNSPSRIMKEEEFKTAREKTCASDFVIRGNEKELLEIIVNLIKMDNK